MAYTDKNKLRVVYGDYTLGVHGDGFDYIFSYSQGGLESIVKNGYEWLYRCPKPTFWINHDASGKAQADGQEFFVGMVGQKCDAASNPSAQPGQEGEKKSVENRVIHRIPPLMI